MTNGRDLGALNAYLHRLAEELYDLSNDPNELNNLANDAAHREVMERMRADMHKFKQENHDPWLPGVSSPFGHQGMKSRAQRLGSLSSFEIPATSLGGS